MTADLDKARALSARVAAVRAYAGTEFFAHFVALLDAVGETYLQQLVHVSPEELQIKQGAARQVLALRACMTDGIGNPPIL